MMSLYEIVSLQLISFRFVFAILAYLAFLHCQKFPRVEIKVNVITTILQNIEFDRPFLYVIHNFWIVVCDLCQ